MSQPTDDASSDDLLRALTGYFERQPEPDPENEALQLDIDAWMLAQKRPVRLRPEARATSDNAGHRVAELVPPPVAAAVPPAPARKWGRWGNRRRALGKRANGVTPPPPPPPAPGRRPPQIPVAR